MDTVRELAPTDPFPKDDGLPALSPDRSLSPATPPTLKSSPRSYGEPAHRLAHSSVEKFPSSAIDLLSSPHPLDTSVETMETSLPSTSRSKLQESPFASDSRSPRSTRADADQTIQRLADYCSEMRALVNKAEMDLISVNVGGNGNPDAYHNLEASADKTNGASDDGQPYRHGQIGAFRHFPRFDQASRPIVSDNWRAKSAADTVRRPQLASLATGSSSSPQSPFGCTPTRSPLAAPALIQPSPHPPPTPVSLSTPITMAFGHGSGHAHHSSTSSLELGTPESVSPRGTAAKDSTRMPRGSPSTDLLTARVSSLSLTNMTSFNGNDPVNKNDKSTTFAVSLASNTLGYCFVRPNGTRTRLVPVDMLPFPLQGIPADESANDRLVALPVPAGLGPDGRSSNVQVLKAALPPSGSNGNAVQSQIDRILAAPSTQHPPATTTTTTNTNPPLTSPSQNPTSSSPSTTATVTSTPKRMKVYCDKWVHEGVCAFTQQGCKYKHEMPSDKATQHQLGLFLGYPLWWKRRQAELARVQQPNATTNVTAGGSGSGAERGFGQGLGPAQGIGERGVSSGGGGFDRSRVVTAPGSSAGGRLLLGVGQGPGSVNGMSSGQGSGLEKSRFAGANELGRRTLAGPMNDTQSGNDSNFTRLHPSQARQSTTNGGLAASRWGGNPTTPTTPNTNSNLNLASHVREKLLAPSWRTPSSANPSCHRGYPDPGLQSYDGAASESLDRRELDRGSGVFLNNDNINIAPVTQIPGLANDTRSWPWDNPHYTRRASQTQQYRPQHQPGNVSSGFNAACTFAFPTTAPNAATSPSASTSTSSVSMSSTSPYGPIAPPLRNPVSLPANQHQNGGTSSNNNTAPMTNAPTGTLSGAGVGAGYDFAPFPARKGWN